MDVSKLLKRLKWNKDLSAISSDIASFFRHFYSTGCSEEELDMAWNYVALNNGLATYIAMKNLSAEGIIGGDEERIQTIICANLNNNIEGIGAISKALVLSSILEYSSKFLEYYINNCSYDIRKEICKAAFKVVEEEIVDSDKNALKLMRKIYDSHYIDTEDLGKLIYSGHYDKSYIQIQDSIRAFIRQLCIDKEFRIATNVKNAFNYDLRNMGITPTDFCGLLKQCESDNFFRGCTILRDLLNAEENLDNLKTWYSSICEIDTNASSENISTITCLAATYAIRMNSDKPDDALRIAGINIDNVDGPVVIRASLRDSYRVACYKLLLSGQGPFLKFFLEKTEKANFDRYTHVSTKPTGLLDQLGTYDAKELLEKLLSISDDIQDVLYVFFNSFLRGAINFKYFLIGIKQKFQIDNKRTIEALAEYSFECIYNINMPESYKIKNKKYPHIRPIGISIRYVDLFVLRGEGRQYLDTLGFNDYLDETVFTTKLSDIRHINNKTFIEFIPAIGDSLSVTDIRELIHKLKAEDFTYTEFFYKIKNANINMLERNNQYTELCIDILKKVLDIASRNVEDSISFINRIQNINFFAYNTKSISSHHRRYKLTPEYIDKISMCWNNLREMEIDPMSKFLIYSNTILRRHYNIEEFLIDMVKEDDQKKFFLNMGIKFTGTISNILIRQDSHAAIVMADIPAYNRTIYDIESKKTKSIQYLYELPLGEKGEELIKGDSKARVSFEIKDYCGDGRFSLCNMKMIHQ